jgi:hypothetical protein
VKATGYPVLYVDHERVGDEEAFLTVKQERFFSLAPSATGKPPPPTPLSWWNAMAHSRRDAEASPEQDPVWWIPLSLLTSENASHPTHHSLWEGGRGKKVERIPLPSGVATLGEGMWAKVNARQTGFFRVKYSEPLLRALQPPLLSLTLSPSDRLGCVLSASPMEEDRRLLLNHPSLLLCCVYRLLDDAFALCKAGYMTTPQLLALLQSYVNENSFPVWASLTTVRPRPPPQQAGPFSRSLTVPRFGRISRTCGRRGAST